MEYTVKSHFEMNGGNILVLQKTLGHSSLTMTMRYAHLKEAKMFNPLNKI